MSLRVCGVICVHVHIGECMCMDFYVACAYVCMRCVYVCAQVYVCADVCVYTEVCIVVCVHNGTCVCMYYRRVHCEVCEHQCA